MLDTRDWCDVDSNEEFCIPELPPLPLLNWQMPVNDSATAKEEESPKIPSLIPTAKNQRFRSEFRKGSYPKAKSREAGYVCFVGKFPNQTGIVDLKSFIESKGIKFTDVRIGPKKKPNANTFGYVDLPTRHDYEKLLSLDGTDYKGRAIRVDHATRKETSIKTPRKKKFQARRENSPTSKTPRQTKSYDSRGRSLKKTDISTPKNRARFQRLKTPGSQKTGSSNKQKYRKKARRTLSGSKGKRSTEAFRRK
jgi:hypothetical protein